VSGKLEGTIVAIDDTGNLISDIPVAQLESVPTDDATTVSCDEHQTMGLYAVDHDQPPMTLIALLGRSGFLELSVVEDSARMMLGIREGEKIVVSW
jgi:S-adenosylmethionine hydrolase